MSERTVCDRRGEVVPEGEKAGKLSLKYESAAGELLFSTADQDICLRCEEAVTNLLRRVLLIKAPEKPHKRRAKKPAPEAGVPAPEAPAANEQAHEAWKEEQG